jgi:hypothetical protein
VRKKVTSRTATSLFGDRSSAHVVGDDHQNRRKRRHRNQRRETAEKERDEQQRERVNHSGDRRPTAVVHVRRRAGYRTGRRHAAKERRHEIGDTLRHELHV